MNSNNHPGIMPYGDQMPRIHSSVYLAPGCHVIGDVEIGSNSSIWFNTVIRGDVHHIRIGRNTNIQDNSVCHVTTDKYPLLIGDRVTVGHMVNLHGCTIKDECLIGIGAIILDETIIGEQSFIAAGSLVTPRTAIPPRSFVRGHPARVIRSLDPREIENIQWTASHYVEICAKYKKSLNKT